MWMRCLRIVAAALAFGSLSLASPAEVDQALASRLNRIEGAFRSGDAGALRSSLAATGKVRVDLKDLTDGPGSYGAGQLEVMFREIFGAQATREFVLRKHEVTVSGTGTAFARGKWTRRAGAQETTDTMTFTLREESGDWRIHEIRSSR